MFSNTSFEYLDHIIKYFENKKIRIGAHEP